MTNEISAEKLAESKLETLQHIDRVRQLCDRFVMAILERSEEHDRTKLEEPEATAFAKADGLRQMTYGDPDYIEQCKKVLGEALDHHYAFGRHHPQHHEAGIADMNLVDLVEMFLDWRAATERHDDGDIFRSIEFNKKRFYMTRQLCCIFSNTAEMMRDEEW
jgi:hypothetical protein